ncbi:carboxypeptidase regulatory-like domain-containing protein [Blastopirellula marina]|uniref:Carboxypeptidase regulatory-like domain-containing protein n=1 Tax=Blastopirellula marina TaxID=124 RepID=A0A2S8FGT1_9BACT|nr:MULTISPECIES: carboxypeptidase-like regulatory domain-containing protein [Pirellulaceae]PQO31124.1 carboxypeptidase regulatory-like domain-containing protein [Blastopirellula marina]RCS51518.1 carboxypeptidase regulatory-like domain-containing protein [Bremerella cremea]
MKCALGVPLLAMLTMLLGCGGYDGPPVGSVSGVVTIQGKPASDVVVEFTPLEGGRGSTGTTDDSGRYELIYSSNKMGAQIGKHSVTISGNQVLDDSNTNLMKPKTSVPKEVAETKREVEVNSGSNTIDLEYP